MFTFQIVTFFLQIIFWFLIAGVSVFLPEKIFKLNSNDTSYSSFTFNNSYYDPKYERRNLLNKLLIRAVGCIIAILITVYMTLPYLLDIPVLITGKYNYATGYVSSIKTVKRDPNEYVYIQGKKVIFFFSSNVEKYSKYQIGYLPHTLRAVNGVKLDSTTSNVVQGISFPFKQALFTIGFIVAVFLLFISSYFLKFKLLILSSLI